MKREAPLFLGILMLPSVVIYLAVFLSPPQTADWLTREDHLYENIQAACNLGAAILFFILYFRDRSGNDFRMLKTRRNLFFLLLGLMFFFGFGEEISWGQRIFHWQTPASVQEINTQNETNIHNLKFFHARGKHQLPVASILNFGRIFVLFCITYCFVVPILVKVSAFVAGWVKRLNLPLVPLWIGFLFPLNFVIYKLIEDYVFNDGLRETQSEVRETVFALLFAGVSLWFFLEDRSRKGECSGVEGTGKKGEKGEARPLHA